MDGNNRWSKKEGSSKKEAYIKGAKNLFTLSNHLFTNFNVNLISSFALSSKNLMRSKSTISIIVNLLENILDELLKKNDFTYGFIFYGNLDFLNKKQIQKIKKIEEITLHLNQKLIIYINYSGTQEIKNSFNYLFKNKIDNSNKSFEEIINPLNIPDPEILIRTGGFQRISDFMLYQISFTELFFTKTLWPDFNKSNLNNLIEKYKKIDRKFGLQKK